MATHGSLDKELYGSFSLRWYSVKVQVAGEFIALLVRQTVDTPGAYIEIWNWTQAGAPHEVRDSRLNIKKFVP
jgi:hypothetical protein